MTRYTTSQTITAPANGTYDIGCWGGGAGGVNTASGAGGGGGAFSYASVSVTAGDQLVLTIPAAAAAGANGGTVTVVRNSITLCSAFGGTGSTGGTTGGVGSVKYAGGNGAGGDTYTDPEPPNPQYFARGGGGGSAGRGGAGSAGNPGTADFGDVIDGSGGGGNTSYAGTEWDGNSGGTGGVAGNAPGGGGGGAAAGGKGAVELIFTASDTAPVITPSTSSFNVVENAAFSQDFNADQGVTWSIVGGTDSSKFSINSSGLLTMPAKDYESPDDSNSDRIYQVTFRATNTGGANLTTDKTVTVTVTNDTTAPTITPATTAFNVNSGSAFSQDFDSGETVTWSIVGGTDSGQFSIDSNGVVSMTAKDASNPVDSNTDNVYQVTFRATDSEGNTTDRTINVTVIAAEYFPTSSSQDAVGNRTWTNLANLYADDESVASASTVQANQTTYTATLDGFDLSGIPDNAVINGIELVTELDGSSGSGTVTGVLQFTLKSGTSSTKSTPNYGRDIAEAVHTLGGSTDVWGLTGSNLTGSGFKSSFNVTMRAVASASGSGSGNPRVDYVKLRIYYTASSVWGFAYFV